MKVEINLDDKALKAFKGLGCHVERVNESYYSIYKGSKRVFSLGIYMNGDFKGREYDAYSPEGWGEGQFGTFHQALIYALGSIALNGK